jgi:GMP synthase (glutamine-hydrolysing)
MSTLEPSAEKAEEKTTSHRVKASGDVEVASYLQIAKEMGGEKLAVPRKAVSGAERESIIVIDFGSQYSMLIARRVRESKVYCELVSPDTPWEKIAALNPKGFILSGGPASVYQPGAPLAPAYVYEGHFPVLGICYGMQVITQQLGGIVTQGTKLEYGHAVLYLSDGNCPLFKDVPATSTVWMSHGDLIAKMPLGFRALAYTENSPIAVMGNDARVFGLQFHPEVVHTQAGKKILQNFIYNICGCSGNWTVGSFIDDSIAQIQKQVRDGRVINAISGGVDSSVTATLIHRAIGDQLTCIFVNHGLLRREEVERTFSVFCLNMGMNVKYIDASERFLKALEGVTDPERKRKIIGEEFIHVFEEEALKIGKVDFLAQGTLYPDVIESAQSGSSTAAKIKTHHNVGGLPARMKLSLLEPLRFLFKDEVREVGNALGLPEEMVWRQPFPGPGLAIRIIGNVTPEKVTMLQAADWIVQDEIKRAKLYRQLWQCFAVLTEVKSVGVMGDSRTYGNMCAIRAVTSEDAMTADWARLPYDVLATISNRIVNEVPGINRVVYDITSKPPGTIEWE